MIDVVVPTSNGSRTTGNDDGPSEQRKDNGACRHTEPAETDRPLASLAPHFFDIEIALKSAGHRRVDLLDGETNETEPREHDQPITERPPECLGGDFALAGCRRDRQPTIQAECLPAQRRVHDPANHEARTDREAAPIVAQAVWMKRP